MIRRNIRKIAAAWKVTDRVIFAGQAEDVFAYYRAADFFVLPTKHDPCSLALLEALGMGLPVISTRTNGATEVMQEAIDGYILADATRIDELAEMMRSLCDTRRRQTMSDAVMSHRSQIFVRSSIESAAENLPERAGPAIAGDEVIRIHIAPGMPGAK